MYMKVGRWCYRHRVFVVAAWVAVIVVVGAVGGAIGSDFGGDPEAPESDSRTGFELLSDNFDDPAGGFGGTIVVQADQGVDDPDVQAAFTGLADMAAAVDGVTVALPGDPGAVNQVATEGDQAGKIAYARVEIDDDVLTFAESGALGKELRTRADELENEVDGLRVELGGQALAEFEPPQSEVIGLAFAIVVLIVAFGSVLAMGLPIAVALAGVSLGISLTGIVSNITVMPDFATVIGAMIGLGVGIDYALFVVTRYREGLHEGYDPETATAAAQDTAGRAVIFAGVTVVVSLFGLLLIGLEFVAGLGIGAAITVMATMIASTTLLPALLGFAKLRVEVTRWRGLIAAGLIAPALLIIGLNLPPVIALGLVALSVLTIVAGFFVPVLRREVPKRTPKPVEQSGWYRWSHLIQDRPWPFLVGGVAVLLFLAVPLLGLRLGFSDEGNYPEDSTTRQAYDLLSEGFGPGFNGPFLAVSEVDGQGGFVDFGAVVRAIEADPGVAEVRPSTAAGDPFDGLPNDFENPTAARLFIVPNSSPQSVETEDTVNRLRNEVIPSAQAEVQGIDTYITGSTPVSIDFSSYLGGRSLLFFGVVLLLSFVLLMAVFRSLLVPLKAVVMNGLSIAAAYGVVVALFQWGHLGSITGIEPAPIEPFIPMMMFAIVFGLSMDYEVFLLSRVKECYERTGDAKNSVADGLASTARVISAAAAIMVVVFGSFVLEDDRISKVFGVGLSVAVLLDATLVRMLLVPATMELLGEKNWWIPRWLDRIIPRLYVEGAPDHEEQLAVIRAEVEAEEAAPVFEEPPVPAGV